MGFSISYLGTFKKSVIPLIEEEAPYNIQITKNEYLKKKRRKKYIYKFKR